MAPFKENSKLFLLHIEHASLMTGLKTHYQEALHLVHIPYMFIFIKYDLGQNFVVPFIFTDFQLHMYSYVYLLIRVNFY